MIGAYEITDTRSGLIATVETQATFARRKVWGTQHNERVEGLSRHLAEAPPYWIDAEFIEAALSHPPEDVTLYPGFLPTPSGFALFGAPQVRRDIPDGYTRDILGADAVMFAAAWWRVTGGVFIVFGLSSPDVRLEGDDPLALAGGVWLDGESLSTRVAHDDDSGPQPMFQLCLPLFVAVMAMAGQRIASKDAVLLPRGMRRRGVSAGTGGAVTVVHLRRREPSEYHPGVGGVDWACRWIVRGHWTNQWYPKAQEHRPILIGPYVKGPPGKPLSVRAVQYAADR